MPNENKPFTEEEIEHLKGLVRQNKVIIDAHTPSQEEKMLSEVEFLNRKREEIGVDLDAPTINNGLYPTPSQPKWGEKIRQIFSAVHPELVDEIVVVYKDLLHSDREAVREEIKRI